VEGGPIVNPSTPDVGWSLAPQIMQASGSHSRSASKHGHESVSQREGEGHEHDMRLLQKRDPSVGLQPAAGTEMAADPPLANTTGDRDAHRVRARPHCFSQGTSAWTQWQLYGVHAPR